MRTFIIGISWRIGLLSAAVFAACYVIANWERNNWLLAAILIGVGIGMAFNLHHYVTDANRKIARFLESVRYSDFAVRYTTTNTKGETFAELNKQFNEVFEAFRQARAEKEANLQFLNTIVQHLSSGVLAFDLHGNLLLSNTAAFQLLGVYRIQHLNDLPEGHHELKDLVTNLKSKSKVLYQPEPGRQIAVQGIALMLRGQPVRLLTLQNIFPELQRKELEAWQNLTRVLRHEMMNSITPISSLISTMQDIVRHDLPRNEANNGAVADLEEALDLVATRSVALMNFVDAYRRFSAVPKPKVSTFMIKSLLEKVHHLLQKDIKTAGIDLQISVEPAELTLNADPELIEGVLINLLKNAREAIAERYESLPVGAGAEPKRIQITAGIGESSRAFIEVSDNGIGIDPDQLEEVFIPFFTTKETGTGVGLSLSKQIMQAHGGNIRVVSAEGQGARFVLDF